MVIFFMPCKVLSSARENYSHTPKDEIREVRTASILPEGHPPAKESRVDRNLQPVPAEIVFLWRTAIRNLASIDRRAGDDSALARCRDPDRPGRAAQAPRAAGQPDECRRSSKKNGACTSRWTMFSRPSCALRANALRLRCRKSSLISISSPKLNTIPASL